jgi:hypothetical protein
LGSLVIFFITVTWSNIDFTLIGLDMISFFIFSSFISQLYEILRQ